MNKKVATALCVFCAVLFGCANSKSDNPADTFYVSYKCDNDTLLDVLKNATSGKVAYFDAKRKLEILSLNYVTEPHKGMHYLKVEEELPKKPVVGTIKYEIVFNNKMVNDSIAYTLKKVIYSKDGWKDKSSMGEFKVFDYQTEMDKKLRVSMRKVAENVLRIIATDTYTL